MSLSNEDVQYIAKLAAIQVSDDELAEVKSSLNTILDYVAQLSSVQTKGVVPTSHVHGVVNAFRDDVVKDSFELEKIKQIAPSLTDYGFRVPKII